MSSSNARKAPGAFKLTLVVLTILIGAPALAEGLECPIPQPTTTQTAIKETEQDIRQYSELLAAQGTGVVPVIVARLRTKFPKAADAEITNYLVTLYCPVLERNASLSDGQKRAQLASFSSRLMQELQTK